MTRNRSLKRRATQWIIGGLLALAAAIALAQALPSYYPEKARTAKIDAINPDGRRIVINDAEYLLADNVVIHAPRAYSIAASRLNPGMTVAIKTTGNRLITEMWVYPQQYSPAR